LLPLIEVFVVGSLLSLLPIHSSDRSSLSTLATVVARRRTTIFGMPTVIVSLTASPIADIAAMAASPAAITTVVVGVLVTLILMITSPVLSAMLVGSLAMIARTSGLVVLPRRVFTPLIPAAFGPDRVGLLLSPRLTPVVLLLMMMGGVQLEFLQVLAQICLMIIVAGTASRPSLVHIIIGSLVSFIQAGLRSLTEGCFRNRT